MTHKTRRQILTVGTAGLAGAAITHQVQANAQSSPLPATQTPPNGRFANKVVLITSGWREHC